MTDGSKMLSTCCMGYNELKIVKNVLLLLIVKENKISFRPCNSHVVKQPIHSFQLSYIYERKRNIHIYLYLYLSASKKNSVSVLQTKQ